MEESKYGLWPKSEEELIEYLRKIEDQPHDYSSIAKALTDVTVAMFNYFASKHGMTGFQASYSGLQFLKITRGIEGPFGIVDGSNLLYPQYDLMAQVEKWIHEWKPTLADKAIELLNEKDHELISPNVIERWKEIAALKGRETDV
jgi:hypothetical protein